MAIELRSYRTRLLEKLTDPTEAKLYINAAWRDSNEMFLEAIKDVAQAHRMSNVARNSGMAREALYRSLSKKGNPTFETLTAVLNVLGLKFEGVGELSPASIASPSRPPLTTRRRIAKGAARKASGGLMATASAGWQLVFNFMSADPEPEMKEMATRQPEPTNVNWASPVTESLPPAHLCNILLKGNYEYSGSQGYNAGFGAE
jgi:probable addiction module antidote protein